MLGVGRQTDEPRCSSKDPNRVAQSVVVMVDGATPLLARYIRRGTRTGLCIEARHHGAGNSNKRLATSDRSDERRVGKEWVSTLSSRVSPYNRKTKKEGVWSSSHRIINKR